MPVFAFAKSAKCAWFFNFRTEIIRRYTIGADS
jgi:hypothetical protein